MTKRLGLAVLIISFSLTCTNCRRNNTTQKEVTPIAESNHSEKEVIKSVLTEMWDAIEKGDIDRYASYVHPDFTQFGETNPVLSVGKELEISGVRQWVASSSGIHTEMEEPRITIKGNVAWITYYWSDSGITNGKAFSSRGKSTRIFIREDGKWLCIHGHYTLLP